MGRKIEIKKIENTTRRQVTYSKRRSSLIKKANEISVFCDIDVILVAFSPSGRVNGFCSRERMGDVLERYMNLPPHSRYPCFKNIQGKVQKLKELDHIMGDQNKLHHLNNQIQHLEEQIKRKKSEIGILHHKLMDYEPNPEDTSLSQVLSLEEHFNNSLKLVEDRKKFLIDNSSSSPLTESTTEDGNDQDIETIISRRPRDHQQQLQTVLQSMDENQLSYELQDPTSSHILLQLDPWLNNNAHPYRGSKALESVTMSDPIAPDEGTSAGNNEVHGLVSNNSTNSLPVELTTGFSSNTDQFSNWFTTPHTHITTHAPPIELQQPTITTTTTTGFQNLQMWGSPKSFEGISFGEEHFQGQVNSSWEGGVAQATSHFDAITTNTNVLNWFQSCDYNINYTTQSISVSLPSTSEGVNVSGCSSNEPYFMTNAVGSTNYIPTPINSNEISESNINGSNVNYLDQVTAIPESSAQAGTRSNNNMCTNQDEDAMDGFWDSDDSILLQNFNFKDLDIIFD